MKLRVALTLTGALLLSGCTDADWTRAMTYAGLGQQAPAPAAAPAPSAPPSSAPSGPVAAAAPDPWCVAIATQDRGRAAGNGFDAPTQQRIFIQSYTQCVSVFGGATPE